MREVAFGHEVVGLNDAIYVVAMNADCHSHDHVLRTLSDATVDSEEVGPFESLETKAVIVIAP